MAVQIFIGSSSEALCYAEYMRDVINSSKLFRAITWKQHFESSAATKFTIEVLKDIVGTMRIGIFFITNDDQIVIRKKPGYTARTNVWFEIGMYAAKYGQQNAIVLIEEDDLAGGTQIPSDYYGINFPTFNISSKAKAAIKKAWQDKVPLPKAISLELRTALKGCFDKKIKPVLQQLERKPTDYIDTISDRSGCYAKAREMIQEAKERIFTVISYERELDTRGYPEGLLPFLKARIDQMLRKTGAGAMKNFKVKRWMNLGAEHIRKQALDILTSKYGKYIEVRDTYCRFIEAVVTEDKVLLPLPKESHMSIGQGIYIESVQIANFFADWFEKKLPEPNGIRLTKKNFDDYVRQASIRNAGHRSHQCYACSEALPPRERARLNKQYSSLEENQ